MVVQSFKRARCNKVFVPYGVTRTEFRVDDTSLWCLNMAKFYLALYVVSVLCITYADLTDYLSARRQGSAVGLGGLRADYYRFGIIPAKTPRVLNWTRFPRTKTPVGCS